MRELIVDNFAGGGGASEGIFNALGIHPDIAINHDATALAMHAANHPGTLHLAESIWKVDPLTATRGRPVGLAWFSPDCKHFSKAKGGRPVKKNIRALAWVVVKWARDVRPRVIFLENVEEFKTWGPLGKDNRPCKKRSGETFKRWTRYLKNLGYAVEFKEIRGADFGSPTIRKRLFMIARCDGLPIVWPEATHFDPKKSGLMTEALLAQGKKPWRSSGEFVIDWTLPCHSIFLSREEGRALGVKRPLADATMERIAKGIKRYVIDSNEPFIVSVAHGYSGGRREYPTDDPLNTTTQKNHLGVVAPVLAYGQHGGAVRDPKDPMATVAASRKDTHALIAPVITKFRKGETGTSAAQPLPTSTANSFIKREGGAASLGVIAAHLSAVGGRAGQSRPRGGDEPTGTGTSKADTVLVAASLVKNNHGDKPHYAADEPTKTIVAGGNHHAVVSAYLAQHNLGVVGRPAGEPVSTLTQKGSQQMVVSAGMISQKGSDQRNGEVREPAFAQTAGGFHQAETRAFLIKYHGDGGQLASAKEPAHTVDCKERLGLVMVHGEPYEIVDIGMRMLTPRELFRAQGFREDYIIDHGIAVINDTEEGWTIGKRIELTKADQVRMCGNSVCPPVAEALVRANFQIRNENDDDFRSNFLEAAE